MSSRQPPGGEQASESTWQVGPGAAEAWVWGPRPAPPSSCSGAGDRGPGDALVSVLVALGVSPPHPLAWGTCSFPSTRQGSSPHPRSSSCARGLRAQWLSLPGLSEHGSAPGRPSIPEALTLVSAGVCALDPSVPTARLSPEACPRQPCPFLPTRAGTQQLRGLSARLWLWWCGGSFYTCPPHVPSPTSERAPASILGLLHHREAGGQPGGGGSAWPHAQALRPHSPSRSVLAQAPPRRHPHPHPHLLPSKLWPARPRPLYSQAVWAASESLHQVSTSPPEAQLARRPRAEG